MEEDQEQKEHIKHVCKFCNKNFPCGRSLGGHMRSHVTNFSAENEKMKKLSSLNNGGSECSEGYGLRENPKKTWRLLTNSSEEKETGFVAVLDKLCKECGRGFQSWKALFGHMKCHSDKEKVILDDDHDHQDDSWNKVVMNDCESDDDDDNEVNVPSRRRRSKRKRTRYMKTTTTTTTSVTSSVSVSEIEHEHEYGYEYWGGFNSIGESSEQEEVAISLMMLSRDVSNWGGFNSIAESSETNLVSKFEGKRVISYDSEIGKFVKSSDKNSCEFGNSNGKNSEILVTDDSTKIDRFINSIGESSYQSNSNLEKTVSKIEGKRVISNGIEIGKLVKPSNKKSKLFDASKKLNSMKNCVNKDSESEIRKKSHKKGKFECTTCNKIFHSYQALGGHRASHKRNKSCLASKIESSENTNEFEESNELMKKNIEYVEEEEVEHEQLEAMELESQSQSQSERVMVEESVPEIRNFLDLNLPASTTDEENNGNNQHAEIYKPWWLVGNNHKQESLVGLLSNYS